MVGGDEQLDGSGNAWLTANELEALELDDHAVDRGGSHPEEALHVGFGWRAPVEFNVSVDEGEILALFGRKSRRHGIDKRLKS